jgi:flagellar motor switch protein FliN
MAAKKASVKKAPAKKASVKKVPAKKASAKKAPAPAAGDTHLDETPLRLSVEIGQNRITLDEALNIGHQSLVELDKKVGDSVDILLNGRLFARGQVVTVSENFGVRITEIVEEV